MSFYSTILIRDKWEMVGLKDVFWKPVQNILSPEIINKEKIKTNSFNNNSSGEEISDYENSLTRKLSVKNGKDNKYI